jgi:hypothetical protein
MHQSLVLSQPLCGNLKSIWLCRVLGETPVTGPRPGCRNSPTRTNSADTYNLINGKLLFSVSCVLGAKVFLGCHCLEIVQIGQFRSLLSPYPSNPGRGMRIRTRKRDHPSRRAESAAAVYAVAPCQFFLTPVNLDSFFAARAPSICAVPSEGPLR